MFFIMKSLQSVTLRGPQVLQGLDHIFPVCLKLHEASHHGHDLYQPRPSWEDFFHQKRKYYTV